MALNLNQELQNKYPHLEVSVLKYSDAMKDNDSKRIDSEFFKKEYLENEITLKNIGYEKLGNLTDKICNGSTPSNGIFEDSGIPYFRSQDFNLLDTEPKQFITDDFHKALKRSEVKFRDILIAIIGATLGKIGFVSEHIKFGNINQNIAKIRIKDEKFNPYFVAVFLDTYFGQYQIFRLATQTAQEYLNNLQVAKIKIPLFPIEFQREIEALVKRSHECLEQSKDLYRQAEVLLYEELGLNPHNPLSSVIARNEVTKQSREKNEKFETSKTTNAVLDCHDFATQSLAMTNKYAHLNISVRPLSQSLNTTGRLDSEYYQQKYDEIERVIKNYRGGYFKISQSEIKDKNFRLNGT